MKTFIAILAGKLVKLFCKIVRRGGTAKPGKIALKICPNLLETLGRGVKCIVVTGSNGKTTSCRIVEKGLEEAGVDYFANRSGANLIEGIATDFIVHSSLSGKCSKSWAVLETDEAASREVCRQLQPAVIFVTNIFVDQVDRFGGVEFTRDCILTAAKNAPGAVLCLNADDSVSASIARLADNKVKFYGLESSAVEGRSPGGYVDVENCIFCGAKLEYEYRTFSHLGGFKCPKCGWERPKAGYSIGQIVKETLAGTEVLCNGEKLSVNLPAMYNIYNAAGTVAALEAAGIAHATAFKAVAEFEGSFGRMEKLPLGKSGATMILVKNGAGCDQVIDFLKKSEDAFVLALCINNNISDGVDISWIDSVDFEALGSCRVEKIFVSGMRAEEMRARLVRAGLEEKLETVTDVPELITKLNDSEEPVIILPTYTAMMSTRKEIVGRFGGTQFWDL